jgi:Uma2 family endonuclease
MSEAEFLALPEVKPYLEYVDGAVRQKPMVNAAHRRIVRRLDARLDRYIEERGGDGGPEATVRLGAQTYRLPDTSYWAPERASDDNSIPSVAVEVRSPGQSMATLREKCRAFRRGGVDTCWLIDPRARTAEVFEGERDAERVLLLESVAMPGFSLALSELFKVLEA